MRILTTSVTQKSEPISTTDIQRKIGKEFKACDRVRTGVYFVNEDSHDERNAEIQTNFTLYKVLVILYP